MTEKGSLLPNNSGWRCKDCGKIVLGDHRAKNPMARNRLCADCVERRRAEKRGYAYTYQRDRT